MHIKIKLVSYYYFKEYKVQRRRQEEKGPTEDEMVVWHHHLNGHESEQTLGDGEGQGSLACCSPWGCKESDTAERLNNKESLESHRDFNNYFFLSQEILSTSYLIFHRIA